MKELLEIRKQVADGMRQSASIQPFLEGGGSLETYKRYLLNVYQYSRHSAKVIAMAAARCMKDHSRLGLYLLHHSAEEEGHDKWALQDLAELGVPEDTARNTYAVPACAAMVGYTHYLAGYANPVSIFGWLYVLEAMGDDLGSSIAQLLDQNLKLEGKSIRFVAGHGVNDIAHTAVITKQLQQHVTDNQDMSDIIHAAEVVGGLYVQMFDQIGQD